jgi:hypothetical protein
VRELSESLSLTETSRHPLRGRLDPGQPRRVPRTAAVGTGASLPARALWFAAPRDAELRPEDVPAAGTGEVRVRAWPRP